MKIAFHPQKLTVDYSIPNTRKVLYNNISIIHTDVEDKSKKWLIYSHGNSQTLSGMKQTINFFGKYFNVVFYDYPEYGESGGVLTYDNAIKSSQEVVDYIKKLYSIGNNFCLYGYSLGGFFASCQAVYLKNMNIEPKN